MSASVLAPLRSLALRALCLLALLATFTTGAHAVAEVTGQELVSSVRAGRTTFDYSYRITVRNGEPALRAVVATVVSSSAATQVIKGSVTLGDLGAGATSTSTDVFTIRQDRSVPFNPNALAWTVIGVPVVAGPATMELGLSDPVVAPDGVVTISPVLRDSEGRTLPNGEYELVVNVAPVGAVAGNAPVVSGLDVSFPKLQKRLLNQDTAIDPEGLYADTDPTDPNYGKETGGRYRITVSVQGSSVTASREVLVLPSGTAATTAKVSQYAGQMEHLLNVAAQAALNGDAVVMAEARAALQAVTANNDFSTTVLGATQALAPPNGNLVTPALLSSRGFAAGPQDAAYAASLATLATRLRAARTQVDALNASALTQESLDALQAAAAAYKDALATLRNLSLSTLGAAQQQAAINQQVASELPLLLDAIKRKSGQLLAAVPVASAARLPLYLADERKTMPAYAPAALYARAQPVQVYPFAAFAFSILTDLSGTARANIIELTVTLVNSLVNIMAADAINQNGAGGVSIDTCLASSSVAYVCPNYRPSIVTGSGFGRDASAVKVALVGCVGGDLIRNLMTLRQPRDIAAGIRLINKVISITNSLQQQGGVGAVVTPDFIDEDELFGGDRLYFANGWPRVNQGRLPCVGIVIVTNVGNGGVSALNLNFLGQCG